jgi:hypothetical protein
MNQPFLFSFASQLARAKGEVTPYIHRACNSHAQGPLQVTFREKVAQGQSFKELFTINATELETLRRDVNRRRATNEYSKSAYLVVSKAIGIVEKAGLKTSNGTESEIDIRSAFHEPRPAAARSAPSSVSEITTPAAVVA